MAVVATGFFDGVHLGHRLVIDTLLRAARSRGEQSVVVTFWPHPRTVLQKDARELRLLSSLQEKRDMLGKLGVDCVEVVDFSKEFRSLTAEEYLRDWVKGRLGGSAVVLGYDNRIGHDSGTPAQIAEIAMRQELDVITTEKVSSVGLAVSSTKIRQALLAGDVAVASQFLCYDYSLEGEVVHGRKLGRTIGYPTANLGLFETMKLVPAEGVYLTRVHLGDRVFSGMTNIGGTIETHILDFDEEIYGHAMRLEFIRRVRGEMRFADLQELKAQHLKDEAACRAMIASLK